VGPGGQRGKAGERARGVGAGRGVRAGRESREEWGGELGRVVGRTGGSGPSERGVSWAGERKGRLGCCWAGVGLVSFFSNPYF